MELNLAAGKQRTQEQALTNCVFMDQNDYQLLVPTSKTSLNNFVLVKGFVYLLRPGNIKRGTIGLSRIQRELLYVGLGESLSIKLYEMKGPKRYISCITLKTDLLSSTARATKIEHQVLCEAFQKRFMDHIFTVGEKFVMKVNRSVLIVQVEKLAVSDLESIVKASETTQSNENNNNGTDQSNSNIDNDGLRGIIAKHTVIVFTTDKESALKIKGTPTVNGSTDSASLSIISPDWNFEKMGIGGLDNEFSAIFRRAFASRIFPASEVARYGIKHVKGILLYGPPGTGKTLMARQIGKMLNAVEPKIISGPEILNKYVGQSEENVRNLFKDAEREYEQRGDESDLHIIIFDEIDAICKQRGSNRSGTGVGDTVVNQLLAKLDGVEQLNNILVIGMTNRKELIDDAILRPGRLEVHMEIGLPDKKGRLQILKIHTKTMRENKKLGNDVDLEELSEKTKNYSGAEIEGLVKNATAWAFNEVVDANNLKSVETAKMPCVTRNHFLRALSELKPAFGLDDNQFENCAPNGVIHFCPRFTQLVDDTKLLIKQIKHSNKTPLLTVLLHGKPGCGKTALATTLALEGGFPFVKLVSPASLVNFSEYEKCTKISKIFDDASKSPLSVIVIDDIERLIEYVPIGPRFSNTILQTLLVLLNKPPPKNKKLFVIGTTSNFDIIRRMQLDESFNVVEELPTIQTKQELKTCLHKLDLFEPNELERVANNYNGNIPIKKLLLVIEMAKQGEKGTLVDRFIAALEKFGY